MVFVVHFNILQQWLDRSCLERLTSCYCWFVAFLLSDFQLNLSQGFPGSFLEYTPSPQIQQCFCVILLMEEMLHHLWCIKACNSLDKLPTSTGADFCPSTICILYTPCILFWILDTILEWLWSILMFTTAFSSLWLCMLSVGILWSPSDWPKW